MEYLISSPVEYYNEHWLPYYLTCTPCHIDYTVIIHLEDIFFDVEYLNYLTGMKLLELGHNRITQPKIETENGIVNKDINVEEIYFKKISKESVMKLYETYKIDFEMFGYSAIPFIDYASS